MRTPSRCLSAIVALAISSAAGAAEFLAISTVMVGPDDSQVKVEIKGDPTAFKLLPARIREAGTITVGLESNAGYPNSITKNGVNYGLTADLGRALAAALGVKPQLNTMPFSAMIPSLNAERVDFSSVLFNDTLARREAIDFLDAAYSLGSSLLMRKDTAGEPLTLDTACGHVISASVGSEQATRLNERSKKCEEEGKKPIDVKLTPSNAEALLAMKSGRVEAALLSTLQVRYILKADPEVKSASIENAARTNATAFGFKKGSETLPAVRAALHSLLKSGALKEILTQYNYAAGLPSADLIDNTKPLPPGSPLP